MVNTPDNKKPTLKPRKKTVNVTASSSGVNPIPKIARLTETDPTILKVRIAIEKIEAKKKEIDEEFNELNIDTETKLAELEKSTKIKKEKEKEEKEIKAEDERKRKILKIKKSQMTKQITEAEADIESYKKELNKDADLEKASKTLKLKERKDKIILDLCNDLETKLSGEDLIIYNNHKDEIEAEINKVKNHKWNIEGRKKITDEMVKDFVLTETVSSIMKDLEKFYKQRFVDERNTKVEKYKKDLVSRRIKKETTPEENDYIDENKELRNDYETALLGLKNGELAELDEIAERENAGKDLNAEEKELKAKYLDIYNEKIHSFVEGQKAKALILTKTLLDGGTITEAEDKKLEKKYQKESLIVLEDEYQKHLKDKEDNDQKSTEIAKILNEQGEKAELTPKQKLFLSEDGEIAKIQDKLKVLAGEEQKKFKIAENEESKPSKIEKEKADALEITRKLLNLEIVKSDLSKEDRDLEEKYHTESKLKINKNKEKESELENKRLEIAKILNESGEEGGILTDDQKLFLTEDGEIEKINLKLKEIGEKEQKKIQAKNEAAEKTKKDADELESKNKRDAFGKMDPEQKRAAAMERYQKIIDGKIDEIKKRHGTDTVAAEAEIQALRDASVEKREGENGSYERKMNSYHKASEGLRAILANKEYQKLSKMKPEDMDYDQKKALEVFKANEAGFHKNLEKIGPSGKDFSNLEIARAQLAKSSQDYKHSFKSKFFGSKVLAGIGNMFGFKWSGIKEGEHTKAHKEAMHKAQGGYDAIRQRLMQNLVGEEHAVRKAWKENGAAIAAGMEGLFRNVKREFVNREYEKLDDLKHVLEGSVKKPAFERFAVWYKDKFWNSIKDERLRTLAKRLSFALVIASVAAPFSAAAAGAVIGSRMLRAGVAGVAGESAAAAVAGLAGGKKNSKGEFVKFAKMRDADFQKSEDESWEIFRNEILEGRPKMNQEIMNKMKTDHEKAIHLMQKRETRVRKGEMWARLLVGGGSVYALSQLDPGHILIPGTDGENIPGPATNPENLRITGDFVPADSHGFTQTFINLKEKMISDYTGKPGFENLSHDQIAEKLIATGKFDQVTGGIMGAKGLDEFMSFSKEHGFWKPEGWNNSNIDSGSVPAGSTVGMVPNSTGQMGLVIRLPDGHSIPINNNFNEALNQHFKGVKMIDSDHLSSGRAPIDRNFTNPRESTNPNETLIPESNDGAPQANDYLPEKIIGTTSQGETTSKIEDLVDHNNSGINSSIVEDLKPVDGSIESMKASLDNAYNTKLDGAFKDYWVKNPDLNPLDNRQMVEMLEKQAGGHYQNIYPAGDVNSPNFNGDNNLIRENPGSWTGINVNGKQYLFDSNFKDLKLNVPEHGPVAVKDLQANYNKYWDLKNNYAREVIKPYEDYVKNQTELAYNNVGQAPEDLVNGPNASNAIETTTSVDKLAEAGDVKFNTWVDEAFGKNHLFRKDTSGLDTKAWNKISNVDANDFMNGEHGADDVYTYTKDEKHLYNTLTKAQDDIAEHYGYSPDEIVPKEGETLEVFIDRLANEAAKVESQESVTSSGAK